MIDFQVIGKIDKFNNIDVINLTKIVVDEINKIENLKTKHFITFIIVDNNEIHKINNKYRHIDRATDVITFANIDDEPSGKIPFELGDIFISYEKVFEQAKDYGHSIKRELAFLITHGVLHSLGYDHMNTVDEKEMFELQDVILNNIKIYR